MRKQAWLAAAAVAVCGIAFAAADAYFGTWNGNWESGGGGGRFDLILQKGDDGQPTGGVSVSQDGGDYVANFTTTKLDGNKLSARYDYPPDGQAEIILEGTFDGSAAGTWVLVPKGQDAANAFASGTWKVARK